MKTFTIPADMTKQDYVWSADYINANIAEFQRELLPYTNKVEDVTYYNDQCASMSVTLNDKTYIVFMPNTFHIGEANLTDGIITNENGEFPFYNLILDEEYAFAEKTVNETFADLESLAEYLKEIQNYEL